MTTTPAVPVTAGSWTFDSTWRAFAGVQGGLALGALTTAAHRVAAGQARPGSTVGVRTVQAHFLAPLAADEEVTVLAHPRRGGGTTSLHLEAVQAGQVRVVGQALVGTVPGPVTARPAGSLPDGPEDGEELVLPVDFVPVSQHVRIRAVGPGRPLAGGPDPRFAVWLRVRDPAAVLDPLLALGLLVDVLPPSLYATTREPVVMPTVELTLHLHGAPPPAGDWLRMEQWTDLVDDYGCVDEAVLHDRAGRVVARARQTRRVPRRQPGP